MKGGFDLFAKPILVAGAGLMAFKKGLDFAEGALNSMGRAAREAKTEVLKQSFENLTASVAKMQAQYAKGEAVFASSNKIFDAQKKSVRELEDATTSLEKAKRLSAAGTEEERKAIENEYDTRKIATDSAKAQQDIIDEVARKRTEAAMKEQQAVKLEIAAREMGKKSVEALARAAEMAAKENAATAGASGFAGAFTGFSDKEIESISKAKEESDALAKSAKAEQEKILKEVAKLRLDSVENIRTAAEQEKEVEAQKLQEQAASLEQERKLAEERAKLAEETEKKITDLKEKEMEARADIEEKSREFNKRAWDKQLADNQEIAKKTVAEFIADNKSKSEAGKGRDNEAKRALRLEGLTKGGGNLSKQDKEWLDAFKAVKGAGMLAEVARDNLKEMEATKQTEALTKIQTLLADNLKKQIELSTGG
jgi:hypothetical protein